VQGAWRQSRDRQAIASVQGVPGVSGAWWSGRSRQAIGAETVGFWSIGAWRWGVDPPGDGCCVYVF